MVYECTICLEEYDGDRRAPVVGKCGHTICRSCRRDMPGSDCPTCKLRGAFIDYKTNYQMIDCIAAFNYERAKHIADLEAVRSELDDKKNNNIQLQNNNSQLENDNIQLQNQVDKIAKKGFGECSECRSWVEQSMSRICIPCCRDSGAVENEFGVLKIIDCNKTDASVLCGSCFLEGKHKGHSSTKYLKMKLLHQSKEFDWCLKQTEEVMKIFVNMDDVRQSFAQIIDELKTLRANALMQPNTTEFEKLLERGRELLRGTVSCAQKLKADIDQFVLCTKELREKYEQPDAKKAKLT